MKAGYDEAEEAYIAARKQAKLLGADELNGFAPRRSPSWRRGSEPSATTPSTSPSIFPTAYFELGKIAQTELLIRRFLSLDTRLCSNDRAIPLTELASVLAARRKLAEAESISANR